MPELVRAVPLIAVWLITMYEAGTLLVQDLDAEGKKRKLGVIAGLSVIQLLLIGYLVISAEN